jgi:hypothetical protein
MSYPFKMSIRRSFRIAKESNFGSFYIPVDTTSSPSPSPSPTMTISEIPTPTPTPTPTQTPIPFFGTVETPEWDNGPSMETIYEVAESMEDLYNAIFKQIKITYLYKQYKSYFEDIYEEDCDYHKHKDMLYDYLTDGKYRINPTNESKNLIKVYAVVSGEWIYLPDIECKFYEHVLHLMRK